MVTATFPSELELVLRVIASMAIAAVIGFEREWSDHPAGVRTHIAVALGSTLFGMTSVFGFGFLEIDDRNATIFQIDPTRVASTIITGIGFLGAGAIVKHGATVRGLTTAGSLWVTCAVGLAIALGLYLLAVATAVVLLVSLLAERPIRALVNRFHSGTATVRVELSSRDGVAAVVGVLTGHEAFRLDSLEVDNTGDTWSVEALLHQVDDVDVRVLTKELAAADGVTGVAVR